MFISSGSLVTKGVQWPAGQTSAFWPDNYFATINGQAWGAYAAIYSAQLWVYTVVNKRAALLSNLPLKVYERAEDNGRNERSDTPLASLLRTPMPGVSPMEWWSWIASTEDIYGEAFAWKQRDRGGRPVALAPLHPTNMTRGEGDRGWIFDNGSTRMDLADADVIHFKRYNPSSHRRGLSPLEPLRRTLENEDASRRATSAFWRNGARPAFVLKHPGNLSEPAQQRLKAQFDGAHAGADRTGGSLVLEEGMEAAPLSITAEEAQYIESRKLNREEVVAAYDMAPPAVHILDRATFSNITEQFRSVYRDTIGPWAHRFESVMMQQLVPDFDDDSLYVEFLMDEVLRGDFETRQAALKQADHLMVSEKRRIENLPYIEGTDVILVNTASMPLDMLTRVAETPDAPDVPLPDNVIPLPVARSVAGRLSWQRSLDEVDPSALTVGLNGSTGKVLDALASAKSEGLTVAGFRDRVMSMVKAPDEKPDQMAELVRAIKEAPAPVVNNYVNTPEVTVHPPSVTVEAPVVNVQSAGGKSTKTVNRDANGDIATIVEEF